MTRFGVHILKRVAYRGGNQHFGNTYYYDDPLGTPAASTLEALVDFVSDREKTKFSGQVSFIRGRLWTQIGTPAQNEMLVDKTLTGTGAQTSDSTTDRERAFLVRFRAGVDVKGRPVYLRKYWHFLCHISGGTIPAGLNAQTSEIAAADRTALETWADGFKSTSLGSPAHTFNLVAKSGRAISGATQAHKFYEHRQLGDEWRGI